MEFVTRPSFALPAGFYLKNSVDAWTVGRMGTFSVNSVVATSLSLVPIVVLSLTVSFAIAKMKWRLSRVVFGIFLAGILVPVQVVLIPLFVIFRTIGIINTLGGLSLNYASFGMSMFVFLMSSYLRYVPNELLEAAIVDGCNVYQILVRVVLPRASSVLARHDPEVLAKQRAEVPSIRVADGSTRSPDFHALVHQVLRVLHANFGEVLQVRHSRLPVEEHAQVARVHTDDGGEFLEGDVVSESLLEVTDDGVHRTVA